MEKGQFFRLDLKMPMIMRIEISLILINKNEYLVLDGGVRSIVVLIRF